MSNTTFETYTKIYKIIEVLQLEPVGTLSNRGTSQASWEAAAEESAWIGILAKLAAKDTERTVGKSGYFSAVSAPISATKYAFCRGFYNIIYYIYVVLVIGNHCM